MRVSGFIRFATVAMIVTLTLPLGAQQTTPSDSASAPVADTVRAAAARVEALRVAVHNPETRPDRQPLAMAQTRNLGQAKALMVVGFGGLLAGAIIQGDAGTILMVGGAVIGLYGLYEYLK